MNHITQTVSLEMDAPTFIVRLATVGATLIGWVGLLYYADRWIMAALA